MRIRKPAVAGYFYPHEPEKLRAMVAQMIPDTPSPQGAVAIVCPHAGYVYSGATAGKVYGTVRLPRRFVLLGPNHTGLGVPLSIWARGMWETPLGSVPIDEEMAETLLDQCAFLEDDLQAHIREHSIEVQLPFLQHRVGDFTIVPICVGTSNMTKLTALAQALVQTLQGLDEPVLLVASTDMSHYIPADEADRLDRLAIERMEQVDGPGLYETVHRHRLTMCGYLPTVVTLMVAKALGATRGVLVDYTHSGKVTGDLQSVVAYAGMVIR